MSEQEEIIEKDLNVINANTSDHESNQELDEIKSKAFKFIIALIVIVGAVSFYYYGEGDANQANNESAIMMERAMPYFEKGDYFHALEGDAENKINNEAVLGFKAISDKYTGTEVAYLSAMYAGKSNVYLKNFTEAKQWFVKALESSSKVVKLGAFTGVAICEEVEGDFESAAKNYKVASQLSDGQAMKDKYSYFAGLCLEKANQIAEAKQQYKLMINNDNEEIETEFITKAKESLSRLGTKIAQ